VTSNALSYDGEKGLKEKMKENKEISEKYEKGTMILLV
jgi:hypothetical protein